MSLLPRHDPPGFVEDLDETNKAGWSDIISSFMRTDNVSPIITPQFYDATIVSTQTLSSPKITWIGFPKKVKLDHPSDQARWAKADSNRILQDEYLEWSVKKDSSGKITKVVFCNEGPEYFEYLAQVQPNTLLDLYKSLHPGVNIQSEDIFEQKGGKLVYNPLNQWNKSTTTGTIMHLIQPNNTLGAEVDLGARATILRKRPDGTVITDSDELIRCSQYGNPDRNSDPVIGAGINAQARTGVMLTIANPVGLYIDHDVDMDAFETPEGHEDDDTKEFCKFTRGRDGHFVRVEFEVPPGKPYVLGDLKVNGVPLKFGAQIADLIKISITANTTKLQIQPRLCGEGLQSAQFAASGAKSLVAQFPGLEKHQQER